VGVGEPGSGPGVAPIVTWISTGEVAVTTRSPVVGPPEGVVEGLAA